MDSTNLEPQDWIIRRRRWRHGANLRTITDDEFREYMETKFYGYAIDRIVDDNLWDLFRHDFEGTTVDQFSSLSRQELVRLRTFLRCGGVYVAPNHRNRTISQSLIEILEEEERHE